MLRLQINGVGHYYLYSIHLFKSPLNSRQQMSETWELSLLLIERHDIIFLPCITEAIFIAVAKKETSTNNVRCIRSAASNNAILVCLKTKKHKNCSRYMLLKFFFLCPSALSRPSVRWNNSAATGWIFIKFDI